MTHALLEVWLALADALQKPHPAFAATAEADCEVDVSARLEEVATLQEIWTCQTWSIM